MQKVAISACLLGQQCRYDGRENRDVVLLERLKDKTLIPFCPEDFCYGTPRPTMDLVETAEGVRALSNQTGTDLSAPVIAYAEAFFAAHPDIDLLIGKDRSPSCGVCSAKRYSPDKTLLSEAATGLMAAVAREKGVRCWDAEAYALKA